MKFMEILSDNMNRTIAKIGYTEPTPIQEKAISVVMEGKDVIGQAQTGTGKTAAFAVPILERIDIANRKVQAIVLCPTRELALQITEEFKKFSLHMPGIVTLAVYGGQPIERQTRLLHKGVQIVVGTPGRVMDHMRRGTLKLANVNVAVLDEADEMLDMGFRDAIQTILEQTSVVRQTLLFSATMPYAIKDLARRYQQNPVTIRTANQDMTVSAISQYYLETTERSKPVVISDLIYNHNPMLSLVFCNTKRKVEEVVDLLQRQGHKAVALHGDMRQFQRDEIMRGFRNKFFEVLVATDVAARGLDVKGIDIVFNYDVPQNAEYYVHRIGRTGRAGREGKAFTLILGRERRMIRDIQNLTKSHMIRESVPERAGKRAV